MLDLILTMTLSYSNTRSCAGDNIVETTKENIYRNDRYCCCCNQKNWLHKVSIFTRIKCVFYASGADLNIVSCSWWDE